nr:hypothetical protein [Tanacetum cinerariifolium]
DELEDDPEEDLTNYPADGGDEGDDEDELSNDDEDDDNIEGDEEEDESSDDDKDDDIDIKGDEEEDEMSIRPQTPISLPSDTEIARLMAIPTPPPSPLSPLSSSLPHIPSPPLPLLSPPPIDPTYKEAPFSYRMARLQWRAEREKIPEADLPFQKWLCTAHTGTYESSAAAAARLREPVRDDLYRFVDTIERGEGSTPAAMEVGYGITDTWDDLVGAI